MCWFRDLQSMVNRRKRPRPKHRSWPLGERPAVIPEGAEIAQLHSDTTVTFTIREQTSLLPAASTEKPMQKHRTHPASDA
jgi:hypothetical protein